MIRESEENYGNGFRMASTEPTQFASLQSATIAPKITKMTNAVVEPYVKIRFKTSAVLEPLSQ